MANSCQKIFVAAAAVVLIFGCVKQGYKGGDCNAEVVVSFYSQSRCQVSPEYPEDITDLLLLVFGEDGTLVSHRRDFNVTFDSRYADTLILGEGLFYVSAWSGISESFFTVNTLTDGTTTRDDILFMINRNNGVAGSIDGLAVYYGESNAFYVAANEPEGETRSVRVNMQEVTNRLTVYVEGLPNNGEGYEITIETDNGSMTLDGEISTDEVLISESVPVATGGILSGEFTLLKLETGHTYTIVIMDAVGGAELYRGSLLGALILKNPEVDLNCDHDFEIRFTAEDQCDCGTYAITEIWVNNWLVHSYGTDL